jgi:tRNA (guanosine-2'-O-)-methyltransferase
MVENVRPMTPERKKRFREVIEKRQPGLTVVLENVHDPHNIAAVLRTSDSVGIYRIYILYTNGQEIPRKLKLGKRASAGARRWVDVLAFSDAEACFHQVRTHCDTVYGTHLTEQACELYDMDLTGRVALVFGNEHQGISEQVLDLCDGNFHIPQAGMSRSLNISVACAVTLYEAFRQRQKAGLYTDQSRLTSHQRQSLHLEYERRHREKISNRTLKRMDQ